MTNIANRILQIALFILMVGSLVLFIFFYINGESMTETVLSWGQILLVATVAILIIFFIIHFITNPRSLLMFLGVVVVFGALYFISCLLSLIDNTGELYVTEGITQGLSRLIGSGLIMIYILAGLAVLSIIVTSIINAFK
jgi:hypothetical protein